MPGEHQEVHLLFQMTLINQERFTVFGFPPSNIFFFFFSFELQVLIRLVLDLVQCSQRDFLHYPGL